MKKSMTARQDQTPNQINQKSPAPENQTEVMTALRQPLWHRRGGFGLNEVIGIAAGIIIAVVVVIPGLRQFATSVLGQLTQWWNTMASGIFSN